MGCGLISIDHGWVRLLGAGVGTTSGLHVEHFPDPSSSREIEGIIAAHDVLGGLFVVHGGGFEADFGEILYRAPDTLTWSRWSMGHADLVSFLLSDRLALFYEDVRWKGWEAEVEKLPSDHGLSAYPFPWTVEGSHAAVLRTEVPMHELVTFAFEAAKKLAG